MKTANANLEPGRLAGKRGLLSLSRLSAEDGNLGSKKTVSKTLEYSRLAGKCGYHHTVGHRQKTVTKQ
jgi:hypothetical protein